MRSLTATILLIALLFGLAALPEGSRAAGAQVSPDHQGKRAVVLSGGGVTGWAWETGLIKGLHEAGIDLNEADLVVGTSAGAMVGAQIRSDRGFDAVYNFAVTRPTPVTSPPDAVRVDPQYFQDTSRLWIGIETTPALRVEIGARAMAATRVISEEQAIRELEGRPVYSDWPSAPLQITAVDVFDGSVRLIDKTQGVPIARAVAASSAIPGLNAPITIGDRRYMDGAVAGTHLDAAAGYHLVVGIIPGDWPGTDRQVEELRAQGSQVMLVRPDAESAAARGPDGQDVSRSRASAEAGYRQAATVAVSLAGFWNGASSGH